MGMGSHLWEWDLGRQKDILRLEVTVHDALVVKMSQRNKDL